MKITLINTIISTLLFNFFYWKNINITFQWLVVCSVFFLAVESILFFNRSVSKLIVNCIFPILLFFGLKIFRTWLYIGKDFSNMPYEFLNEILLGSIFMYVIVLLSVWIIRFIFFKLSRSRSY